MTFPVFYATIVVEVKKMEVVMLSSPKGIDAVPATLVADACMKFGGLRAFVRYSPRSYTRFVCCCIFSHYDEAEDFSRQMADALAIPFCRVRALDGLFSVSVPCLVRRVRAFSSRPTLVARGVRYRFFVLASVACQLPSLTRSCSVTAEDVLRSFFSGASSVGFSGSRSTVPVFEVGLAVSLLPSACSVSVGCADGVDARVRELLTCQGIEFWLYSASSYGRGRGSFAARSIACVESVSGGLWVSFPSRACPTGLMPSASRSRCFSGHGSGTWASLAYAIGSASLSLTVLVFLPPLVPPPPGWGLAPVLGAPGWFFSSSPVQLSLFD